VTHPFRLEPLSEAHDRAAFSCGEDALDRYIRTQATQDICRRIASCFAAIEADNRRFAAYYTIAGASIATPDLPPDMIKRLPRYPTLPAVRIGHLVVDLSFAAAALEGLSWLTPSGARCGPRRPSLHF